MRPGTAAASKSVTPVLNCETHTSFNFEPFSYLVYAPSAEMALLTLDHDRIVVQSLADSDIHRLP